MTKKLIIIDEIDIGNLSFTACVIEDENNLPAYAILLDNLERPLILFREIPDMDTIDIIVNLDHTPYVINRRTPDIKLRRQYYQELLSFVSSSEALAEKTFFKRLQMKYLKDIDSLKQIKYAYLNE